MRRRLFRRGGGVALGLVAALVLLGACASVDSVTWDCPKHGDVSVTVTVGLDTTPLGNDTDKVQVTAWDSQDAEPSRSDQILIGENDDATNKSSVKVTGKLSDKNTKYTLKAWLALNGEDWSNGDTKVVTSCK